MKVTDSFTNTNGTALATHNANWTVHGGTFTIQSNELQASNAGADSWATYAGTFENNQSAECVASATVANGDFAGLIVRGNTGGTKTYYAVNWDSDSAFFYKYLAGAYTPFTAPSSFPVPGDRVRLEIVASVLKVFINGVEVASVSDGDIASGSPGVTGFNLTGTRLDTWEGSDDGAFYVDGTEDYYTRASPFNFNSTYTVSFWFKPEAGRVDYHHFFHVGGPYVYDGVTDFVGLDNDGSAFRAGCAGGSTNTFPTNGTLTAGTWYLIQMVRESTTSLKIYADGTLRMTLTDDVSGRAAATLIAIGSYNTAPCRGFLASVKVWTSVLSAGELVAEGRCYQPVKALPWAVWPLYGHRNDESGNARTLTLVGTEAFTPGPPIVALAPFPSRWARGF